jgi:DNA replication protein DnaC
VTLTEVIRALKQLRVSGMANTLEPRIVQAQADHWAPLDLVAALVQDELQRRQDRLLERRVKRAGFRDAGKTLDTFDFDFNRKLDRRLVFELAAGHFIAKREDALFLGPPGTGKSHIAQGIGHAAIQQGYKVLYREAHILLEELAEATIEGTRKDLVTEFATVPLLIIDDSGCESSPPPPPRISWNS